MGSMASTGRMRAAVLVTRAGHSPGEIDVLEYVSRLDRIGDESAQA
jgi:hypothetical protein